MQLRCKACFAPFRPEDMRPDVDLVQCASCNEVFDLAGYRLDSRPSWRERLEHMRDSLPSHLRVEEDDQSTRISWRWFGMGSFILAFFCALWDGFLFVLYSDILSLEEVSVAALPLLHVATGVGLTYLTLAGFVNRTRITVSASELTRRHGPLPWPGNLRLLKRDISQLHGQEVLVKYKGMKPTSTQPFPTYALFVTDRSGHTLKLLSDLKDKNHVFYLEQTLERRLGLEDRQVKGELTTRSLVV